MYLMNFKNYYCPNTECLTILNYWYSQYLNDFCFIIYLENTKTKFNN